MVRRQLKKARPLAGWLGPWPGCVDPRATSTSQSCSAYQQVLSLARCCPCRPSVENPQWPKVEEQRHRAAITRHNDFENPSARAQVAQIQQKLALPTLELGQADRTRGGTYSVPLNGSRINLTCVPLQGIEFRKQYTPFRPTATLANTTLRRCG